MRRIPDWVQLVLGVAFIAGLTAYKITLGSGVMMIDFFIIPVVGIGWFASSRSYGYVVALIAAADSAVLAVHAETQASWQTALLTGLARLALYLLVLALLGMMRRERAGDQQAASTDKLTGAANARLFERAAQAAVERAQRYGGDLSLVFLDLDDFKGINDELGHSEGDHVLSEVGHVLRATTRKVDTVARIGGDEFAVLMPETGADEAGAVMRRVLGELARLTASDGRLVQASVGLVTFDRAPGSVGEMIVAADELMYAAKRSGKDRVERAERAGSYAMLPAPLRS